MRICDRCKGRPIRTTILDKKSGSEFDLCESCLDEFNEFLAEEPEAGKKPKRRKLKDASE